MLARGFQYGTAPDAVVIGWNGGEHGGVHLGGQGAYQAGFTHHMFLPMPPDGEGALPPPPDAPPVLVDAVAPAIPAPPAPEMPPVADPGIANS